MLSSRCTPFSLLPTPPCPGVRAPQECRGGINVRLLAVTDETLCRTPTHTCTRVFTRKASGCRARTPLRSPSRTCQVRWSEVDVSLIGRGPDFPAKPALLPQIEPLFYCQALYFILKCCIMSLHVGAFQTFFSGC